MTNTAGEEVYTDVILSRANKLVQAQRAFIGRLRQARIERGMTLDELADLIGLSTQELRGIEYYAGDAKLSVIRRYALAVGVSVTYDVDRP